MLGAAIWGNLSDHKDTGAGISPILSPPTPRLPSALSPPADWHQLCSGIPGLACQHTESSWPCHHRRLMQPTEEAPYTVWLATTWESTTSWGTSATWGYLSKLRTHNQPTSHRDKHRELGTMWKTELCSKLRRQDKTLEEELSKVEISNFIQ